MDTSKDTSRQRASSSSAATSESPVSDSGVAALRAATVCGADVELANFYTGLGERSLAAVRDTALDAAKRVLRCVEGVRAARVAAVWSASGGWQDSLRDDDVAEHTRVWLSSNGGCVYIDMSHLEICVPEVESAFDHVAAWHAMLRIARGAADRASSGLPDGQRIELVANNSDGRSHSWGGHLNFLIPRRTWDMTSRRATALLFLASHHAASIVLTGAGKTGAENGQPPVDYQLSQRADFVESLFGTQTTYARPLVNTRDEPHCGVGPGRRHPDAPARLHVIHCDTGLCHGAQVLKVGVEQIVLAMMDAGRMPREALLDDPVGAIVAWSHDLSLRQRALLVTGEEVTAVDLERRLFDAAVEAQARGELASVPRAPEILALWDDTLTKLAAYDLAALAPRLDWALKLDAIRSLPAGGSREERAWKARHVSVQYAALAQDRGLYWAYEDAGVLERHASEEDIARLVVEAPANTRARARANALREFPREIWDVDWDFVHVRPANGDVDVVLAMDDPRDVLFPEAGDARVAAEEQQNATCREAWGRSTALAKENIDGTA